MDASPSASRIVAWTKFAVFAAAVVGGVAYGAAQMNYAWKWHQVPRFVVRVIDGQVYPGPLLKGLAVTLEISAVSFVAALAIGLATALCRMSGSVVARGLARIYLEVVRNTPLLVQIYLLYFVFAPILGLDRWFAAIFALAVFEGAFAAEIFRGGIQSIDRGQREAARSMGLQPWQELRLVVLPQAIRRILPPLGNQFVYITKISSLASVIGLGELTRKANELNVTEFRPLEIYTVLVLEYLVLILVISFFVRRLERRFGSDESQRR